MKILLIVKLFSENYIYPENDLVIIKENCQEHVIGTHSWQDERKLLFMIDSYILMVSTGFVA